MFIDHIWYEFKRFKLLISFNYHISCIYNLPVFPKQLEWSALTFRHSKVEECQLLGQVEQLRSVYFKWKLFIKPRLNFLNPTNRPNFFRFLMRKVARILWDIKILALKISMTKQQTSVSLRPNLNRGKSVFVVSRYPC